MTDLIKSNISTLKLEGQTAVLTIDNGSKNYITEPEFIELKILQEWIEEHPSIHSLIITGAGRHFSHGADVSLFDIRNEEERIVEISEKLEKAKELLNYIENLPLITVAAINGGCFGGGLEIALSCQFRICTKKAFFGLPEIMHGVVPGMGGMERMCRLLGKEKALKYCLTGEIITATNAQQIGLVSDIVEGDLQNEVTNFVNELAKDKTVLQIRSIVQTMNKTVEGNANPSKGVFETVLINLSK